jgi:hypothetical protein
MTPSLHALVDVRPPADWQSVARPNGTAFVERTALARSGGDVTAIQLTLFVSVRDPAGQPLHAIAEDLMSRRVRQGYPTRFDAAISGRPALGFGWSDGVSSVLSYFVMHPAGWVVEFQVARDFHTDPLDERPLPSIADQLLANVQWRADDVDAV